MGMKVYETEDEREEMKGEGVEMGYKSDPRL
jgi:hypothetical protein